MNGVFDQQYELSSNDGGRHHVPSVLSNEVYPMWPDFMKPVYVVSIRRNRFDGYVNRMGPQWMRYMKRFNCVNGNKLDMDDLVHEGILPESTHLGVGQIGCALSHIGIWTAIANGEHEHATVFEDDVSIHHLKNGEKVVERINNAVGELKDRKVNWGILWWGYGPWAEDTLEEGAGMDLTHWSHLGNICPGFFAYTMSRELARELISEVFPLTLAIDVWLHRRVMAKRHVGLILTKRLCFVVDGPSETGRMIDEDKAEQIFGRHLRQTAEKQRPTYGWIGGIYTVYVGLVLIVIAILVG